MPAPESAEGHCPVCAEALPAGARKCKACGALRSWTALCESCGSPLPETATVCHECGRFPRSVRTCAACRQPLHLEARTCGGCGALQWFGGHLHVSNSTLSLVVALITSFTALGAVLANMKPFASSDPRVFFQAVAPNNELESTEEERRFWLSIFNSGNRPAGILDAILVLNSRQGERKLQVEIVQPAENQRLVPGGESLVMELEMPDWNPKDFSIPSRPHVMFKPFLNRAHHLELRIFEHGRKAEVMDIEGVPQWVLPALLCRAAQGSAEETSDPCREISQ
ncbi:MAG TPA: zinc ribbon domain-containing protein [Thermoanaerobaculia bacterium]|nr:zinc ribbon domain-containing protein [Thermoanaerobaculia bacterium]